MKSLGNREILKNIYSDTMVAAGGINATTKEMLNTFYDLLDSGVFSQYGISRTTLDTIVCPDAQYTVNQIIMQAYAKRVLLNEQFLALPTDVIIQLSEVQVDTIRIHLLPDVITKLITGNIILSDLTEDQIIGIGGLKIEVVDALISKKMNFSEASYEKLGAIQGNLGVEDIKILETEKLQNMTVEEINFYGENNRTYGGIVI